MKTMQVISTVPQQASVQRKRRRRSGASVPPPLDEVKVFFYKQFVVGDKVAGVVPYSKLKVGGETITGECQLPNGRDRDNAAYQRTAMARFDELLDSHPSLARDVTRLLSLLSEQPVEQTQICMQRLPDQGTFPA